MRQQPKPTLCQICSPMQDKNHTLSQTKCRKMIPYPRPKRRQSVPYSVAHTRIANILQDVNNLFLSEASPPAPTIDTGECPTRMQCKLLASLKPCGFKYLQGCT